MHTTQKKVLFFRTFSRLTMFLLMGLQKVRHVAIMNHIQLPIWKPIETLAPTTFHDNSKQSSQNSNICSKNITVKDYKIKLFGLIVWMNDDPVKGSVLSLSNIIEPWKELTAYSINSFKWIWYFDGDYWKN